MFNKTVKQVMAQFDKTIADLNVISEREKVKQEVLDTKINTLRADRNVSIDEMQAATRISDKLSKLVS